MRVRRTVPAVEDLTRICDRSDIVFGPSRARQTALEIYEAVDLLMRFPRMGRHGRRAGTCELALSGLPFVAVYRLQGDVIEIVRVLHGSQAWP